MAYINPPRHKYFPFFYPENPVDYVPVIEGSEGLGYIPPSLYGKKVAIIGAGCAGLSAAFELMRIGLEPVVYEASERIGGRAYTYRFPGDPEALAEIGSMRVPVTHRTTHWYTEHFGLTTKPFPSPLTVQTTLFFNNVRFDVAGIHELPPILTRVIEKWETLIIPLIEDMSEVWEDPVERTKRWEGYSEKYKHITFYQAVAQHGFTDEEINLFGACGIGVGGLDSIYSVSFLEVFRIVLCQWGENQKMIIGGSNQLCQHFWNRRVLCEYWGEKSVAELHKGYPRKAVVGIDTRSDGVQITDCYGTVNTYDAVIITCSLRAIEMNMDISRSTFSEEVWGAIRTMHMIPSGKVYARTRTAFWKDERNISPCTISDETFRAAYTFECENTESGLICLSYVLGDSSIKLNSMPHDKIVKICVNNLERIYGEHSFSRHIVETFSFYWEKEAGYHGAFKLPLPGQMDEQIALSYQHAANLHPDNGVYLAGDSVSWLGGWIEGAFHSGLEAARASIKRIAGAHNVKALPRY